MCVCEKLTKDVCVFCHSNLYIREKDMGGGGGVLEKIYHLPFKKPHLH